MIRNDGQALRTRRRIAQIRHEIRGLESEYSGDELDFWASQLRDEEIQLKSELNEYYQLKKMSLEDAVTSILQTPTLLENVGDLLAKLRIAANLTQEEMAKRLGWRQPNLSRFENENYCSQSVNKVSEFAGSLGVQLLVVPGIYYPDNSDITYAEGDDPYLQLFTAPQVVRDDDGSYVQSPKQIKTADFIIEKG